MDTPDSHVPRTLDHVLCYRLIPKFIHCKYTTHFSVYIYNHLVIRGIECSPVLFCSVLFCYTIVRKEGNVLFNDALNTFYLRLYGVGHMVKDHSNSERGNPLPLHGLLFPINGKSSFICTTSQTG